MSFRQIKEEFVVVFCQDEAGATLKIAIRQQVIECPTLQEQAEHTNRVVAMVRERCRRECAPIELRTRIIALFPHRCQGQKSD